MNKKASIIFSLGLVFTTLGVLIVAFIVLSEKLDDYPMTIGERQADLIRTYQKAESILFYIDQAAKLSARQSVYDLASRGGYYDDSACGSYLGYSLWNNDTDKCYPTGKGFSEFMNENLNSHTSLFGLENRYVFVINPNHIIGIAKNNLELNIVKLKELEEKIVSYVGECSSIPTYAAKYVGSPYLDGGPSLVSPEQAQAYPPIGTTCAKFVRSVYHFGFGKEDAPQGNAYKMCDSPYVEKFYNKEDLQPGDIFSTLHVRQEKYLTNHGYDPGHTGIYVGRGHVSDKRGLNYRVFTPDPEGDHIFIHSGTVGYSPYKELFTSARNYAEPHAYCRHKRCTLVEEEPSEEGSDEEDENS